MTYYYRPFGTPKRKKHKKVVNHQNAKLTGNKAVHNIFRGLLVALLTLSVAGLASAQDDQENLAAPLLKFKGGVGVIPVTGVAANGTVNLNIVRGVTPGAPW